MKRITFYICDTEHQHYKIASLSPDLISECEKEGRGAIVESQLNIIEDGEEGQNAADCPDNLSRTSQCYI